MNVHNTASLSRLAAALEGLGPGAHLCSICERDAEHFTNAALFIQLGLKRGEKCFYVVDETTASKTRRALIEGGIDVQRVIAAKALVLTTPKNAHPTGNVFDPCRMLTFWKRACEQAKREGFVALRAIGEADLILNGDPATGMWMAYESWLTRLAKDVDCSFLCQYNRHRFPPDLLPSVIRAHPAVIHRGSLSDNIFHASGEEELSGTDAMARDTERLLSTLRRRQRSRSALRRRLRELNRREQHVQQALRLREALESSPVPFTILRAVRDESRRIIDFAWLYVNSAAMRVLGPASGELAPRRVQDVISDAWETPGLFSCFVHVVESGEQQNIECASTRDGVQRWWQSIVAKLDDGVAVWFLEITERTVAEKELQRRQAYMAEGQRISHIGSWAWDVSRRAISFWSLEHFRIMGLDPAGGLPTYAQLAPMVHPDDLGFIDANFERAVREPADFDHGYRIIRPDGTLRHVRTFGRPVFDQDGALTEYVGTIIDVTEQKRAEEMLRETQAELARVSRMMTLGELTASIAHEVAQPLTNIITDGGAALRWLAAAPPNLEEVRLALSRIAVSGRRASEVVGRIRSLVKKADSRKEDLSIVEVIGEVIALTSDELRKNHVVLHTQFDARLPLLSADRVQIQQVMLNLIVNAVEAISMRTEGAREIAIGTWQDERGWIHVAVRDSGVGLGLAEPQDLFKAFYTTKSHGMGIGLSVSRTIIEAHSGKLWAVRNDDGPGATFHFMLPFRDAGG